MARYEIWFRNNSAARIKVWAKSKTDAIAQFAKQAGCAADSAYIACRKDNGNI